MIEIFLIFKFLYSIAKYSLVMCYLHTWYHVIQNQGLCIKIDCYGSVHAVPASSISSRTLTESSFGLTLTCSPLGEIWGTNSSLNLTGCCLLKSIFRRKVCWWNYILSLKCLQIDFPSWLCWAKIIEFIYLQNTWY